MVQHSQGSINTTSLGIDIYTKCYYAIAGQHPKYVYTSSPPDVIVYDHTYVCKNLETEGSKGLGTRLNHYSMLKEL